MNHLRLKVRLRVRFDTVGDDSPPFQVADETIHSADLYKNTFRIDMRYRIDGKRFCERSRTLSKGSDRSTRHH